MKSQNTISVEILVSGRVQGVGFRRFVQKVGLGFEIEGWVRNLDNGQVQVQVTGSEDQVKDFVAKLRQGPLFSKVDNVVINPLFELSLKEKGFIILPDGDER